MVLPVPGPQSCRAVQIPRLLTHTDAGHVHVLSLQASACEFHIQSESKIVSGELTLPLADLHVRAGDERALILAVGSEVSGESESEWGGGECGSW